MTVKKSELGIGLPIVILIVVAIVAIAGAGVVVYKKQSDKPNSNAVAASTASSLAAKPLAQGDTTKTYTSTEEQVTFRYPTSWTESIPKSNSGSVTPGSTDGVTLKSPSGAITITWNPALAGYSNGYNDQYPLNTVVGKAPIPEAGNLFVVSGVTTLDSKTYYPWVAVQDGDGVLKNGVQGDVLAFRSKHAVNKSTGNLASSLFSTSGLRANIGSPGLSQADAIAWFSGAEVQEAKKILLSLTYQR
jgi:hypothetical protein